MQEGLYPYLVIEKRNNDFEYINIADLDLFKDITYNNLATLDGLLKHYSEEDIKSSIIRANVIVDKEIEDKKLIIKYGNYKLPLLTKDILDEFNFRQFLEDNYSNKRFSNIYYNKLASIVKNDSRAAFFKDILDIGDIKDFYQSLDWLNYLEQREFYFYVYNEVAKKEELRDNGLKREKIND